MQTKHIRLFCLLIFVVLQARLFAQHESDYIRALGQHLNGQTEVRVSQGRVDIVTATHAIEVERAHKWKNSIGQALWYSLQTNQKAGIILLMESADEYKYYLALNSALEHAGISGSIDVWVFPRDFPGVDVTTTMTQRQTVSAEEDVAGLQFWLSTNSNKRHRRNCRWFRNSKGRLCTAEEGVAAKCCH